MDTRDSTWDECAVNTISTSVLVAALFALTCGACGDADAPAAADAAPAAADAAPALTWTAFAADFFATYCSACHGAGDALRDYTLLAMVRAEQAKIRCGVSPTALAGCTIAARMFPIGNGAQPSDAERLELVRWIDDGAAE